jgi:DNA-binding FadR family transcriptional regulator
MATNNLSNNKQLVFIDYLLSKSRLGKDKLPPIASIAEELGISAPNVREQLAIAKVLGLVNIQPRTGITILPYDFTPAVSASLYYAVKSNYKYFEQFSDLRNQIEKVYFIPAVLRLQRKDIDELLQIVNTANGHLKGNPIRIPHEEHKKFHLKIYKNLDNNFIDGVLESYWEMYEMIGLNTYADISYLQLVWKYHHDIAQAIMDGEINKANKLLEDHIALIDKREDILRSQKDAKKQDK